MLFPWFGQGAIVSQRRMLADRKAWLRMAAREGQTAGMHDVETSSVSTRGDGLTESQRLTIKTLRNLGPVSKSLEGSIQASEADFRRANALRADAWDEGYRSGHACVGADDSCKRLNNPYRSNE